MQVCRVYIICLSLFAISFALEPAKVNLKPLPHLRGDEQISIAVSVPYLGGRQSPGDQIGTTWYDYQANGSFGQRIVVDDLRQAHIVWMKMDASGTNRYVAWNFRHSNGAYYGETQASESWSGYVQMDITRDLDPDSQRTVIAYHYNAGTGYYSWIDIDAGNGWGALPNDPKSIEISDHIWPYIAVANNNNIILASGDQTGDSLHLYLTTDEGNTWSCVLSFDSCATLSQFVRASEKRDTNKVAFVHTQFITDTITGDQMDNDVWYVLSDDGGVTWGPHTNITNYQPSDTVRAYCDVNAVFDDNDYLHIVWTGRRVDSAGYYEASKIFHWDEYHDTITVVNSPSIYYNEPGGWWIEGTLGQFRRLPADEPQCVYDINDVLYCLWHGNDDTTDVSAGGIFNGELYGSYSTDNGITWSNYVNLTNTRSPGAPPGACYDENYMTAHPCVYNDSIWTTYIEDKDAGGYPLGEGVATENPVRCWIFHKDLISGIEEDQASSSKFQEPILRIEPNPFTTHCVVKIQAPESPAVRDPRFSDIEESDMINRDKNQIDLNIYDASGRMVYGFPRITQYALCHTLSWLGTDQTGQPVPAGVYFVELGTGDEIITRKVVKLR